MGGKLLQADINRDTQNFAIKGSYRVIDGVGGGMVKSPTEMDKDGNITGSFKKSKKGLLKLIKAKSGYQTVTSYDEDFHLYIDELKPVFEGGVLLIDEPFEVIRERASKQ